MFQGDFDGSAGDGGVLVESCEVIDLDLVDSVRRDVVQLVETREFHSVHIDLADIDAADSVDGALAADTRQEYKGIRRGFAPDNVGGAQVHRVAVGLMAGAAGDDDGFFEGQGVLECGFGGVLGICRQSGYA